MDEKMKNMKNLIEAKNFEDEKNYIEWVWRKFSQEHLLHCRL